MDVVYPYKARPYDLELKYSLRSLARMEHGQVIIAGDQPKCMSNRVVHVAVPPNKDRFKSSTANILAAAETVVESDQFVVMHDDMFLLQPWTFKHENRGTIEEYLATGNSAGIYRDHVEWTRNLLKAHGVSDPLWFGLHTPTVYDREKLIDLITDFRGERYLLRTLYHNLFPQPSVRRDDVKLRAWSGIPDGDVVSLTDQGAWKPEVLKWLQREFPRQSVYEKSIRG